MVRLSTGDADKMAALCNEIQKHLKGQQREVFDLLRQGATVQQIVIILHISEATVRSHKRYILHY